MRRLYLELKNQRLYFFVPPLILFVLVPLTVLTTTKNGGNLPECATISQLFVPCFSAWWPLFILKEYLNSPGKELLFVYNSRSDSLILKTIVLWVFYSLHVVVLFVYYTAQFDFGSVWFLFIAVIIQSLFMVALTYFLSLLLQNTFLPLIVNFVSNSVFMLALYDSPLSIFEMGRFSDAGSLDKSIWVAVAASILLYVGYRVEKRLYKNSI